MIAHGSQVFSYPVTYMALIINFHLYRPARNSRREPTKSATMHSEIKEPTPLYSLYNTVFYNKPCNGNQVQ